MRGGAPIGVDFRRTKTEGVAASFDTPMFRRTYEPVGAARELFKCRDAEVLLSGPAGTGKSRACLEKLHMMALKNAGMRGIIIRKTATSLTSTALVTWKEHVVKEALEAGILEYYGGSGQEPAQYRYTNGSVIVVGGMDRSTRIMSSEYDVAYVQEAIELTEDDWEAITTRLRNGRVSFQQIIADTNPSTPTHWLKQRIARGQTTCLESRHQDNPTLFDRGVITKRGEEYIRKLDNLTGVRRARLRDGHWVAAEGMIYEEWDESIHLIDQFKGGVPPLEWRRFWSIDFGYTNPFVAQLWAEDPDGRLVLYREFYQTRWTVDKHAKELKHAMNYGDTRPSVIICDHDAEGRAQLEQALGMRTIAANKKVKEGIQAVKQRLVPAGDGKPRLSIVRNCTVRRDPELVDAGLPTGTQQEIPGYIWDGAKEAPVKANDHGMDAMRYLVQHLERRIMVPKMRILGGY